MPDNDHQARSTRFSKSGTTVFVRLRVDRRAMSMPGIERGFSMRSCPTARRRINWKGI